MKMLALAILFWPVILFGQSQTQFDGTWVAQLSSVRLPKNPEVYLLQNGNYECSSCIPEIHVKADGKDHPVAGSPYFTAVNVTAPDSNTVEIVEKKSGKVVFQETDIISASGDALTEKITDSEAPKGEPVTAEETLKRVKSGPAGADAISGSWQPVALKDVSANGLTVTYEAIPDGLKASNPNGEGYAAKFNGKEYPIEGDPAHDMVTLRRVNGRTIQETDTQDGRPHYELRMTVAPDGKSMTVRETDLERGTKMVYTMVKK